MLIYTKGEWFGNLLRLNWVMYSRHPVPLGPPSQRHDIRLDDQTQAVDAAAADALDGAADEQDGDVAGDGAENGADQEGDEGEHEADGAAEHVAHGADDGHGDGVDEKVRGAYPEGLRGGSMEVSNDGLYISYHDVRNEHFAALLSPEFLGVRAS
jgi:hypothetical protein